MNRSPSFDGLAGAPEMSLAIDRLSVEGVDPSSAQRLGAALERRLGTLLEERGMPSSCAGPTSSAGDLASIDVEIPGRGLDVDRLGPERAGALLAEVLWQRLDEATRDFESHGFESHGFESHGFESRQRNRDSRGDRPRGVRPKGIEP